MVDIAFDNHPQPDLKVVSKPGEGNISTPIPINTTNNSAESASSSVVGTPQTPSDEAKLPHVRDELSEVHDAAFARLSDLEHPDAPTPLEEKPHPTTNIMAKALQALSGFHRHK